MASTNKTTNYELSQFIGTDKPTFLGDYNGDMQKIDTAIAGVAATASGASSTAASALTEAQSASSTAASAATTAATADTNATAALTTAGNAATAASAAQSTADSAASAASAADAKAVTADGKADAADAKAVAADGKADSAIAMLKTSLKQTLTAGQTSVTFTNAAITATARGDLYVKDHTTGAALLLYPTAVSESAGSITFTFEAQSSDVDVALWIVEEATA